MAETIITRAALNRRRFARLMGAGALAVAAGVTAQPDGADAGITWCRVDPIVDIDGNRLHIYVWSRQDDLGNLVIGATRVTIALPPGSSGAFVWADDGFGKGYHIEFATKANLKKSKSGTQVHVTVHVPASTSQSVVVDLERFLDLKLIGSQSGSTNKDVLAGGWL